MFWTMSRVKGSIAIGPRGLSGFFQLLKKSIASSAVNLPFVAFTRSKIIAIPSQPSTEKKSGIAVLTIPGRQKSGVRRPLGCDRVGSRGHQPNGRVVHLRQFLVGQEVLRR